MIPVLLELVLERRGDRDAVEHGVDGDLDAGEPLLLLQRDAELVVVSRELGIDLVEALELGLRLGRRVVDDVLVVDLRVIDHGPGRLGLLFEHLLEPAQRLEPEVEEPLGLFLLRADQPDDVFVESGRGLVGLDVGHEAVLVLAVGELFELGVLGCDGVGLLGHQPASPAVGGGVSAASSGVDGESEIDSMRFSGACCAAKAGFTRSARLTSLSAN